MAKWFLFVLIISFRLGLAQVAKDDFMKINKTYKNNTRITMKMKYEVYKNAQTKTALQTETGEVKLNGRSKYTKIGSIQTVENDQYTLIVDGTDKHISLLGKKENSAPVGITDNKLNANLEKLLESCEKVVYKKEGDHQSSYLLYMPGGEYSEVKILFNTKTWFIEKMILYYSDKQNLEGSDDGPKEAPRLEITYYEINNEPHFKEAEFTKENYLIRKNGKWQGSQQYQGYTVDTHLLN